MAKKSRTLRTTRDHDGGQTYSRGNSSSERGRSDGRAAISAIRAGASTSQLRPTTAGDRRAPTTSPRPPRRPRNTNQHNN